MTSTIYKSFFTSFFCVLSVFVSATAYKFHPFYVSVTEINYNAKTRSLEISCKMFAEDVESVLQQNYKTNVDLSNEKQLTVNNRLMNDYMVKHLSLNVESKPVNYKFVGFEKDRESVYCYLEIPNISGIKKIGVNNSVLYDFKPEQINIVHVIVNGNRESTKLDYPKNQANFSF